MKWPAKPKLDRAKVGEVDGYRPHMRLLAGQVIQFSLQVIKFCEAQPKDETSKILARQLLRSGTSVGANYRAACLAKSKPTFISKMGDVLEEADESGYWVELLVDAGKADQEAASPLLNEARELVAIAVSSINTAKRNSESED